MKQLKLFRDKPSNQFGGNLRRGKRKLARPLGIKRSNHLVLKVSSQTLLLRNKHQVELIFKKYGERLGVKIYSLAVQADHIHASIKIHSREAYKKWIRAVTSRLVALVRGLKFAIRPWTRIVSWGRAFARVKSYIEGNQKEAKFILAAWQSIDNFALDWRQNFRRRYALADPWIKR